ncbi:MAG: class I SAM-dependent methyltransferase [Chloroflexi bacterium]|nr:class I SAM-dependent methyltransferase [Chloroflexota bacterium]
MSDIGSRGRKPVGTREWYDFIGELSNHLPGIHLGGQDAMHKLLDLCQLSAASRVLDVGCGAGHTACLIAGQYGSLVQGIDISEVMIGKAQERAHRLGLADKVEFRVADAFDLPFDDEQFDVVIIESVLTPLPGDKRPALAEMARVVQSGGLIAANESTVAPSAPPEFLALLDTHPAIHGTFTPQTLRSLFEQAGLRVIHMTDVRNVEAPGVLKQMGLGGVLSFMVRVYPKILLRLLRDARFREASRIDDHITKRGKPYMGYTLIVGQKPE